MLTIYGVSIVLCFIKAEYLLTSINLKTHTRGEKKFVHVFLYYYANRRSLTKNV